MPITPRPIKKDPAPIPYIIHAYRLDLGVEGKPLSTRAFATRLNKLTRQHRKTISHQSISNWERGITQPNDAWLYILLLMAVPGTWQHRFALDIRAARYPDLYDPASPNLEFKKESS